LAGGHSGVNIHEDRGNAIKFLVRFLKTAGSTIPFQLVRLSGGSKHNAIPREAEALILLNPDLFGEMEAACRSMTTLLRDEYSQREEALSIQAFREDTEPVRVIAAPDAARYLDLLTAIPHGALRIGPGREGVVISSTNLAICTQEDSSCTIITSHRSIIPSAINEIASQVKAVGTLAGAEVIHEHGYPAWMPDYNSELLMRCTELYRTRHGENPRIRVIHAGLECAYFKEHFTELDMISFGPRIMHAHSPSEMVEISSVGSMWDFLTALLEHLAESRPA
ncbi:MAG: M20/M25/M40 family metallo-hydrolase, partial [Desulfomonilia bacterium]|nr:M20/M25/M40 family metallo-hydrolase [Desulfomonilia bacterium]